MLFALIGCIILTAYTYKTLGAGVPALLRILVPTGFFVVAVVGVLGVRVALVTVAQETAGTAPEALVVWQWVGWAVVLLLLFGAARILGRKISGQQGLSPEELEALEAQVRNR